jgi:DNA-binding PadR family transcriptional regulator
LPSRRTRKAYRITERGHARFEEMILADDTHADDEKAFALKLAFCGELPPEARLELLERRRLVLLGRLDRARRTPGARSDRSSRSLLEHGLRATQRDLEWVDGLIAAERDEPTGATSSADAPVAPAESALPPKGDVDLAQVQEGATR